MAAPPRVKCTLENAGFVGDFHCSDLAGPRSGVLVIGGSTGGLQYASGVCQDLAEHGLPSLGVAYHGAPGLPALLSCIPLEYFKSALTWLSNRPEVNPTRVVVMGASRGSEAALLSAVHFPELVAGVVVLVPGNVVLCSWPPGAPAWTLSAQPLPYTSQFGPTCDNEAAVIPVEKIEVPLFLLSAGRDEVWPSSAMAEAIVRRRNAFGIGDDDRYLDLPFSGHRVSPAGRAGQTPAAARQGPLSEDHEAAVRAWEELVRFIQTVPPRPA